MFLFFMNYVNYFRVMIVSYLWYVYFRVEIKYVFVYISKLIEVFVGNKYLIVRGIWNIFLMKNSIG